MKAKTFVFELTNTCQEHCNFCYSVSYSPRGVPKKEVCQLSADGWKSALDGIYEAGAEAVDFSGGEPTLHQGFPDILSYAKSLGLITIVSTNGSTISNPRIRNAIEDYADYVALSLHSFMPEVHDRIKGRPGSFKAVMKSIGTYYEKTAVKVNTVVCRENIGSVAEMGDLLDIEDNDITWKVSKVLLQEAGSYNRQLVGIEDHEFDGLEKAITSRYPTAHTAGRILFRRPSETVEPYLIVRSDGRIYIPSGEKSIDLGLNVVQTEFYTVLNKRIASVTGNADTFIEKLNETHDESYSRPNDPQR